MSHSHGHTLSKSSWGLTQRIPLCREIRIRTYGGHRMKQILKDGLIKQLFHVKQKNMDDTKHDTIK